MSLALTTTHENSCFLRSIVSPPRVMLPSVLPSTGVPPLPRCRVGRGWAKWPSLRPLAQTARAVFPQAAFLGCAFLASSLDKTRHQRGQADYTQLPDESAR